MWHGRLWRHIGLLLLLCGLAACDATQPSAPARLTAVPAATPLPDITCDLIDPAITCLDDNDLLVLQTDAQHTVNINALTLTFNGTLLFDRPEGAIAALEESVVVSSGGQSRVLRPGTQVTLVDLSGTQPPSTTAPYAIDRARTIDFNALPRRITLPQPLTLSPDEPVIQRGPEATPQSTGCVPDEEWPFLYTVQRGDTLTRIAGMHDLTLAELQAGNCITDPNSLQPGDVMRVPVDISEGLPEIPARFYADRQSVPPGECATLYWQTENAAAVFLNMQPVDANATVEVCPSQTSDYTLRVRFSDEVEAEYTVRLLVVLGDSTPETP